MLSFWKPKPFDPARDKDKYDLSSKVVLITGANAGLGKEQAKFLCAYKPAKLYVGARSAERAAKAITEIKEAVPGANVEYLEMDLTKLASVDAAAKKFLAENSRLDILVNNAGVMARAAELSGDGYEIQFATNHMGHFLLTRQLLPILEKTAAQPGADVRIINLSSQGEAFAPRGPGFEPALVTTDMAAYSTMTRYGQSKLANVLFTNELAKRYPAITSVSVHPGAVDTNLADNFRARHPWLNFFVGPLFPLLVATSPVGAYGQTWASVAPLAAAATAKDGKEDKCVDGVPKVVQGEFYHPVAVTGQGSKKTKNTKLAEELWEWSEAEMVKKGF